MTDTHTVRQLTSHVLHTLVRDREPFQTGPLKGVRGTRKKTGELPSGLATHYKISGAEFTLVLDDTPIAWVTNGAWSIPDVEYSPVDGRWIELVKKAAGAG